MSAPPHGGERMVPVSRATLDVIATAAYRSNPAIAMQTLQRAQENQPARIQQQQQQLMMAPSGVQPYASTTALQNDAGIHIGGRRNDSSNVAALIGGSSQFDAGARVGMAQRVAPGVQPKRASSSAARHSPHPQGYVQQQQLFSQQHDPQTNFVGGGGVRPGMMGAHQQLAPPPPRPAPLVQPRASSTTASRHAPHSPPSQNFQQQQQALFPVSQGVHQAKALQSGGRIANPASTNNASTRPAPCGQTLLTTVTFNCLNQIHYEHHCRATHKMSVKDRMARLKVDIERVAQDPSVGFICLQEVQPQLMMPVFQSLKQLGFYTLLSDGDPKCSDCVAIASRISQYKTVGLAKVARLTNSTQQTATGKAALIQLYEDIHTHILVKVASVHLFWEKEDGDKVKRAQEVVSAVYDFQGGNYIVAGDFNIDYRTAPNLVKAVMRGWFDATDDLPWTAVTGRVTSKLDYVFCTGPHIGPDVYTTSNQQPVSSMYPPPNQPDLLLKHEGPDPLQRDQFPSDHAMIFCKLMLRA